MTVFWDVKLYSPAGFHRASGRIYSFHIQGPRVSQASGMEKCDKLSLLDNPLAYSSTKIEALRSSEK
jgi:hypothetical protein